jgi:hypothetical protein
MRENTGGGTGQPDCGGGGGAPRERMYGPGRFPRRDREGHPSDSTSGGTTHGSEEGVRDGERRVSVLPGPPDPGTTSLPPALRFHSAPGPDGAATGSGTHILSVSRSMQRGGEVFAPLAANPSDRPDRERNLSAAQGNIGQLVLFRSAVAKAPRPLPRRRREKREAGQRGAAREREREREREGGGGWRVSSAGGRVWRRAGRLPARPAFTVARTARREARNSVLSAEKSIRGLEEGGRTGGEAGSSSFPPLSLLPQTPPT